MKYLIIILLTSTSIIAKDLRLYKYEDKQLHMGATYVISSFTAVQVFKHTRNKDKAMLIGFAAGMTIGIAKELYDIKHGNPQFGDIVADLIGSTLGCLVITIPL